MNGSRAEFLIKAGLFLALVLSLCWGGSVEASVFRSDSGRVYISNLHIIDDDLFVFGEALSADGEITGDLFSFAYTNTIRGTIRSSANLFGYDVSNKGIVEGSFRAWANMLDIDGEIDRNALLFAQQINISRATRIGRDLHAFGSVIHVDGEVGGKTVIKGGTVILAGHFDNDVDIKANKIVISSSATINGNLNYVAKSEDNLTIESGSDIRGDVVWEPIVEDKEEGGATWFAVHIASTIAAFLFGLVVVRLFRPYAEESFKQLKERTALSLASGVIGAIGLTICITVLIVAALFLLSGWILMSQDSTVVLGLLLVVFATIAMPLSAFIGATGWIIFYSGEILIAFLLGYYITSLIKKEIKPLKAGSLLIGLIILLLVYNIPYFVGSLIYIVTIITGAGAILLGIRHCRKGRDGSSGTNNRPLDTPTA
jgi:cytoskeletal protein CcmA (bactofilin family)